MRGAGVSEGGVGEGVAGGEDVFGECDGGDGGVVGGEEFEDVGGEGEAAERECDEVGWVVGWEG